jgi:hypothetical protein
MMDRKLRQKLEFGFAYGMCTRRMQELLIDAQRITKPKLGIRFSWKSAWCGVHYSPFNKRVCINFVPFVTVYYVYKGGLLP